MTVFFVAFIAVCLWQISVNTNRNSFNADYMSVEKTGAIKGLFVIIVFFSHFFSYAKAYTEVIWLPDSYLIPAVSTKFGQLMVTMFLFYSGYGIMESVKKKKHNYVVNMPVQRILKLLIEFDIAVALFVAVCLFIGKMPKIKTILLSLVGWSSVGNSNWYIFAILAAYIISFIAFFIFRKNHYLAAACITLLSVAFVLVMHRYKDKYWYDTFVCYACGVWYSLLREKIEKIVQHNDLTYFASFAAVACVFVVSYIFRSNFYIYEIEMVSFVALVLLFTMKVSVYNPVLSKFGEWVFAVYILQRIPMILFNRYGLIERNMYLTFVLSFAVTVALTMLYQLLTGAIGKQLKKLSIKPKAEQSCA